MKDKNYKKEKNCQEGKKRYSKDYPFQNDLSINEYSKSDNQESNNTDLQCPNDGIPASKEIFNYLNFWDNKIKDNNKNYCVKQQDKLNEYNDYYEKDIYKTNQLSEKDELNVGNKLLNTNNRDFTSYIVKESLRGSLSLKDILFEDLLIRKEDIEKCKYIPKFEEFQNIPKYEGLTKKYFNHVRNEWFREILHKESFIEYRNEVISKRFFQNNKDLFNLIETNQYPEGILIYYLIKNLELSFPKLEKAIYGINNNNIIRVLQNQGTFKWEGLTSRIKSFILSIKDKSLKQQVIKEFQKYLKTKVYNGFMRNNFPRVENFTIKDYPEGWLILKLCEINLISDTKLGKLIDYHDLPYHLTKLRGFKGDRINSIKIFLSNIVDKEKREKSFRMLSNYIEFIVFSQLNREEVEEIDEFLDINPKKWLTYNLCVIYLTVIRDFGKKIDYSDIKTTVHTQYDFSDIIIKRIRNFIKKTDDLQKREKATKVLSRYLKRAIYNKLKKTNLPNYQEFKSKMHPALWLIVQICSIYLLHPFELEKLINYSELSKRLKVVSYFTNNTIIKFRNFIRQNGKSEKKQMAREAINRFLEVRNEEFQRYTGPRIQNLEKLTNFPELVNHLEYVVNLGTFPEEILEGYHEYPRISQFNQQFRYIKIEKKRFFIKKMISDGLIKKIDRKDFKIQNSITNLIELSKNKYYKPSEIYTSHNSPGHEFVLNKILEENSNSICMEIPIWMWYIDHYLTGHIDLILFLDEIIYVCDYKPEEAPIPETTRLSYSFMRSIPQVASYALVLKNLFIINDIMCITFNKKGAWIYEPETTLTHLNNFIKKNKQYKASDRPWEKYFL